MKKTYLFTLALTSVMTVSAQKEITPEVLSQLEQSYEATPQNRALQNAISANSIKTLALSQQNQVKQTDEEFAIDITNTGITNQESSGRCWMFTGMNVLRHRMMQRTGLRGFMFSHVHLFFYDQLEKANLFLQSIIDTRSQSLDSQQVRWLFQNPLSDGGTYTGVADLVTKYGLVPKECQAETYTSNHTDEIDRLLKTKLREFGILLREKSEAGATAKALEAMKVSQMKTIYHILVMAYGEPVKKFTWAPRKDGKKVSPEKEYTPLEFAHKYVLDAEGSQPAIDLYADYVMLMNDPSRPYNKVYDIDMDRHTYEGHNWVYLNLDIEELKPICIASLRDSIPMYFSCDVGKFLNRKTGLLDVNNYDYGSLLGTTFTMDKRQRIQTLDSGSSHAMTLTSVDLDADGRATKWKVENSWGADYGFKGSLIMTAEWFDEYMFRIAVNKKYVPQNILKLLNQKPILLPAWDPMFKGEE